MAKTKALISFAVTAKLICVFVFAYANRCFSHDASHIRFKNGLERTTCIKQGFWPPLKPKIEKCFITYSLDSYNR